MTESEPDDKKADVAPDWLKIGWKLGLGYAVCGIVLTALAVNCEMISGAGRACPAPNEVGDWLAGVSAPLAFVALVVAVLIQSQELSEQRKELRLTRAEFELQRAVMAAQATEAKRQAAYIGTQTELMSMNAASMRAEAMDRLYEKLIGTLNRAFDKFPDDSSYIFARPTDDALKRAMLADPAGGLEDVIKGAKEYELRYRDGTLATSPDFDTLQRVAKPLRRIMEIFPDCSPAVQYRIERRKLLPTLQALEKVLDLIQTKHHPRAGDVAQHEIL